MKSYTIYSVEKLKFASIYVPYPADIPGHKSDFQNFSRSGQFRTIITESTYIR